MRTPPTVWRDLPPPETLLLGLAAAKVAIAEYVEVRRSARRLVVAWAAWGTATFIGLLAVVHVLMARASCK